jgi:hypothetical protein
VDVRRARQTLHIRTPLGPSAISTSLVRDIDALDSNIVPGEIITMREQVDRMTTPQLIVLTMLTVFGALALILATIGVYGVMPTTVAQRALRVARPYATCCGWFSVPD